MEVRRRRLAPGYSLTMVDLLLRDIEAAMKGQLYSVALVGLLTLPDICGAIEFGEGKLVRERYVHWLEEYGNWMWGEGCYSKCDFRPEDIYELRCNVLHLGVVDRSDKDRRPLRLSVPDRIGYHARWPEAEEQQDEGYFVLPLPGFCLLMLKTVRFWQMRRFDQEQTATGTVRSSSSA